jgi:hypothetical protein
MKLSTSTKALLIAAAAIVLLFVLGDRFGMRSATKDPKEFVIELDTAVVVAIHFEDHADPQNAMQLLRNGATWERRPARTDSLSATAEARDLLARFHRVPVKRDMGMIRLLGERYHLTESTLCRITFADAEGRERALNLGSSTFAPGAVGSWTYVNVPGEKEVYAVEGLLVGDLRAGH